MIILYYIQLNTCFKNRHADEIKKLTEKHQEDIKMIRDTLGIKTVLPPPQTPPPSMMSMMQQTAQPPMVSMMQQVNQFNSYFCWVISNSILQQQYSQRSVFNPPSPHYGPPQNFMYPHGLHQFGGTYQGK